MDGWWGVGEMWIGKREGGGGGGGGYGGDSGSEAQQRQL